MPTEPFQSFSLRGVLRRTVNYAQYGITTMQYGVLDMV